MKAEYTYASHRGLYLPSHYVEGENPRPPLLPSERERELIRRASPMTIIPGRGFAFSGGGGGWASWDETSESGLASDDIFVCMFENTTVGGNEEGQGGGLSGADLVLTQSGDVPGATGSPPSRQIADASDNFAATEGLVSNFVYDNTWTIIIKGHTKTSTVYVMEFWDSANSDFFNITGNLEFNLYRNGVSKISATTTDAIPSSGDFYIAFWTDGTYLRGGWSTTKPTKWSDFDTTKRVSATVSDGYIANCSNRKYVIGSVNSSMAYYYYVVYSKTCLIDNAA